MKYDFDEIIERAGTGSVKYDLRTKIFGTEDVIPMWVADMDFRTPDFIADAVHKQMEDPVFGYTCRDDAFFNSVAGWVKKRHGWDIRKEWITFSPGVVSGLSLSILGLTAPGDRIIIQPPVYHPFYFIVTDSGRELVQNPLVPDNGRYHMDFEHLRSVIDPDTRMMILSNPHNPGGTVWKEDELRQLGEICVENGIILLSDEIHCDLVTKAFRHTPAASVSEAISDITITCMAPSKTFNCAGLSTSVVIIPNAGMREQYNRILNAIHVGLGNIFGNAALAAAYEQGEEWLEQLLAYIGANIDYAADFFRSRIPGIRVAKPEASYLLWLDCRELGMPQEKLCEFFIREAKLGLNDGSMFGKEGEGFMRMNIGCPRSVLQEALENLEKAVKGLRAG
ncbi:cystathionine beta-lyase [Desulfonema ishimotonii]|uniref:cysteine-S-conjugate beta-lyase n=1 Tax=Desulfonema ishimotonii TaxID=45657 RepID=A0A401G0U5_9BACT|nr:PatB family C-S lyase [Desulfonema ishimotonii]GBC62803.1 cystathionine beta-lyase [Desulfonema ishimotonii]